MKKLFFLILVVLSLSLFTVNHKADQQSDRKGVVYCVTPTRSYTACLEDANNICCCSYQNCEPD